MIVQFRKMEIQKKAILLLVIVTTAQCFTISNGDQSSSTSTSSRPLIGLSGNTKTQQDTKYSSTFSTTSSRPSFLSSSNTGAQSRPGRDTSHQTSRSQPTTYSLDGVKKSPAAQLKSGETHRPVREAQQSSTTRPTLLGSSFSSTTRQPGLLGSSQFNQHPVGARDQNRQVRETPTSSTTRSGLLGSFSSTTSKNIQHPASYQNREVRDTRTSSTTSRSGLLGFSNIGQNSASNSRKVRETSTTAKPGLLISQNKQPSQPRHVRETESTSTTAKSGFGSSTLGTDLTRGARDVGSSSTVSTTTSHTTQGNIHPGLLYQQRQVREAESASTTSKSKVKSD